MFLLRNSILALSIVSLPLQVHAFAISTLQVIDSKTIEVKFDEPLAIEPVEMGVFDAMDGNKELTVEMVKNMFAGTNGIDSVHIWLSQALKPGGSYVVIIKKGKSASWKNVVQLKPEEWKGISINENEVLKDPPRVKKVSTGSTTPVVTTPVHPTNTTDGVIKSQPVENPTNTTPITPVVTPVSTPIVTDVAGGTSPVIEDTTSPPQNQPLVTKRLPQAWPAENFLIGILILSLLVSFFLRKYIL